MNQCHNGNNKQKYVRIKLYFSKSIDIETNDQMLA